MICVGTLESNDCLICIKASENFEINFINACENPYAEYIKELIAAYCAKHGFTKLYVQIEDKGALDFCILARLKTALERL